MPNSSIEIFKGKDTMGKLIDYEILLETWNYLKNNI